MNALFSQLYYKAELNLVGAWKSLEEQIWDRHRPFRGETLTGARVAVITGGNRGIGLEVVKILLERGWHVIMGCRNPEAARKTLEELKSNGTFECLKLDLMSLNSVREFAEKVVAMDTPVHVLFNNAGIMFGPRKETEDGFEAQLATNHLGHFLLTHLLMPKLEASGTPEQKARIVNVSSIAHHLGSHMKFDDLQLKHFYNPEMSYGNSKAAQILFTKYLASQLKSSNVSVFSLHPGVTLTDLFTNVGWVSYFRPFAYVVMKTARQAGESVAYVGMAPDVEGESGGYFENSRRRETSAFTNSVENQKKMWEVSCQMLGIDKFNGV